ncbi:MAG: ATP-binding cassette domain-containing protein, partial [Comamonadaceae bacterium]
MNRAHFFIAGTVRENLTLWADVDDARLLRAVHDACLDDVLAARPGGIDATVLPHAGNFSGGQRQRLEIARALLREPAVLVLDEAIDGLDAALEMELRARLRARGCALVIVSHRAGTLAACDRLLRVAGGRIEAAAEQAVAFGQATVPQAKAPRSDAPAGPPSVDVAAIERPEAAASPAQLDAALRRIARWSGAESAARAGTPEDRFEDVALLHGLLARRVRVLEPRHWEWQALPLIAFRRADGAPVLLLPGDAAIDPVTGRRQQLVPVRDLLPDAWTFMAPPAPTATAGGLLRACFRRARGDLSVWAGCAALATATALLLASWLARPPSVSGLSAWTGLALLAAGAGLAECLRHLAAQRAALHVERDVLVAHALRESRLRLRALRSLCPGDLGTRLQGLPELLRRLHGAPLRAAQDAITLVAGLAMLCWLVPALALVAMIAWAASVAVALVSTRSARAQEARAARHALDSRFLLETLMAGMDRLRSLAADALALQHWSDLHERQRSATAAVALRCRSCRSLQCC